MKQSPEVVLSAILLVGKQLSL